MSIKEQLHEKTGIKKELLPSGYQMIGNILVLNLKKEAPAKKIANAIHELVPSAKTIMQKTAGIKGEYREPSLKKLWGDGTITIHKEHDCKFKLDVAKVMWAKGNLHERKRLADLVKKNENILDMFAGIGYFTIPIGVHNPSAKITAIEKNPTAHKYLKENIELNKLSNVKAVLGDSKKEGLKHKADRVIMGYLPEPRGFLETAFKALKNKGVIHYEGVREEGREESLYEPVKKEGIKQGYKCSLLNTQVVKSYGPKKNHVVVDVECYKKGEEE